ncbi:MAG: DUF4388 domain-containing protein [Thermoanaerobaculia bacterium]
MSVIGDLSDFDPGDLITVLGLLGKSGKLRLNSGESEGMVVFRGGKIIYAASSSFRENLGSMLLSRSLIDEAQLVAALEQQHKSADEKRLGNILIETGALSAEALESVIRDQVSRVLSEFIPWSAGEFKFDSMEIADHGEVELPAGDLLAPFGLSTDHVLLEAAQRLDEGAPMEEMAPPVEEGSPESMDEEVAEVATPEPTVDSVSLGSIVTEIHSPEFKGESLQELMKLSANSFGRCVLFSARKAGFRPIAHFGVDSESELAENSILDFVVPRNLPGILSQSAEKRRTIMATLPMGQGDEELLKALGGTTETKSIAEPLIVHDDVVLVLYGDRIRDGLQTGWIEVIEGHLGKLAQAIQADIERELADLATAPGAS